MLCRNIVSWVSIQKLFGYQSGSNLQKNFFRRCQALRNFPPLFLANEHNHSKFQRPLITPARVLGFHSKHRWNLILCRTNASENPETRPARKFTLFFYVNTLEGMLHAQTQKSRAAAKICSRDFRSTESKPANGLLPALFCWFSNTDHSTFSSHTQARSSPKKSHIFKSCALMF